MQTDWKAPKGRILNIDLHNPAPEKWREVVPAGDDAIESFTVIGGKLFVDRLHNVTSRIAIYSLDGARLGEVDLPGPGTGRTYGRTDRDEGLLSFPRIRRRIRYTDTALPRARGLFGIRMPFRSNPSALRPNRSGIHRKTVRAYPCS